MDPTCSHNQLFDVIVIDAILHRYLRDPPPEYRISAIVKERERYAVLLVLKIILFEDKIDNSFSFYKREIEITYLYNIDESARYC